MNKTLAEQMAETHDSMVKCEVCGFLADAEWRKADDDGTYYTYRCDKHPATDNEYREERLEYA